MGWILLPNGVTVTLTTLTRSSLVRIQVRQPQNLCSDFPAKVFVFFLFPRLSAHNNLETTAAIGYNKRDKATKTAAHRNACAAVSSENKWQTNQTAT